MGYRYRVGFVVFFALNAISYGDCLSSEDYDFRNPDLEITFAKPVRVTCGEPERIALRKFGNFCIKKFEEVSGFRAWFSIRFVGDKKWDEITLSKKMGTFSCRAIAYRAIAEEDLAGTGGYVPHWQVSCRDPSFVNGLSSFAITFTVIGTMHPNKNELRRFFGDAVHFSRFFQKKDLRPAAKTCN